MTIQEQFLWAILASPDSDLPRLQYADWLKEQGDPRGEFIRPLKATEVHVCAVKL